MPGLACAAEQSHDRAELLVPVVALRLRRAAEAEPLFSNLELERQTGSSDSLLDLSHLAVQPSERSAYHRVGKRVSDLGPVGAEVEVGQSHATAAGSHMVDRLAQQRRFAVASWRDQDHVLAVHHVAGQAFQLLGAIGEEVAGDGLTTAERIHIRHFIAIPQMAVRRSRNAECGR